MPGFFFVPAGKINLEIYLKEVYLLYKHTQMTLTILDQNVPSFYEDPLILKYLRILGRLSFEALACPKEYRQDLLPDILRRAAQVRRQIKGRRIQLINSL